jgi:hypothetical protein
MGPRNVIIRGRFVINSRAAPIPKNGEHPRHAMDMALGNNLYHILSLGFFTGSGVPDTSSCLLGNL